MKSIFEFKDYRSYLSLRIAQSPKRGRGMRSSLAEAAQCQVSYISRVLSGEANINLEQADLINSFLGHSKDEAEFFFLMVQFARAGSTSLQNYFAGKMDIELERRLIIKERIGVKETLSREDQAIHYSNWQYAAVHILISIEGLQTKEALSQYLHLPATTVSDILDFLVSIGLAQLTRNGRYTMGKSRIHLERDSPLISQHHTNWRMQALRSLERMSTEDLHYSVVVGISEKDMRRIREISLAFIQEAMKIVDTSAQSGAHALCLDFFRV